MTTTRDDGLAPWFKTVQPGVLLKGYFEFVQPSETNEPPLMDLAAYVAVVDALFKQCRCGSASASSRARRGVERPAV